MKKVIHINRAKISKKESPIKIQTYKEINYFKKVIILDKDEEVAATINFSPDKLFSCGAKVWISITNEVIEK